MAEPTDGAGIVTARLSRSLVRICARMVEFELCGLGAVSKKCWLSGGVFTLITGKLDTD